MSEMVFISSVQKELADERKAVAEFIANDPLLRRFFVPFLFEDLPASDRRPGDVYLAEVGHAALYVGLFGYDYGWENAEGLAPTEREFDHATACGKPRLIFVKGDDDGARHPKMQALLRKAGEQLIRRRFATVADLRGDLYASLIEHLERTGRLRTKPFDAAACPEAMLDDLSAEKLRWFLGLARRGRQYPLREETAPADALEHLNLLDSGRPSHAAVLLFGRQPQRFLPASELKCMHFHGTEVRKPIPSYQIYRGTVFDLVDQALDFVLSKINRSVGTRALGPQAPVVYELPREAVSEAIVNAVAHRDYASLASVQVMLFADRLEVWSPGELRLPLTLEKLAQPHPSLPTNPLLAEPLYLAQYIEKAGSGILDMFRQCAEAGLRPPTFRQEVGCFIQTLWRPAMPVTGEVTGEVGDQVGTKLEPSRHQVDVLRKCMEESGIADLMELVGRSDRTKFRNQVLHPLLEAGWVEMTQPDSPRSPTQKYHLTEKGRDWLTAQGGQP